MPLQALCHHRCACTVFNLVQGQRSRPAPHLLFALQQPKPDFSASQCCFALPQESPSSVLACTLAASSSRLSADTVKRLMVGVVALQLSRNTQQHCGGRVRCRLAVPAGVARRCVNTTPLRALAAGASLAMGVQCPELPFRRARHPCIGVLWLRGTCDLTHHLHHPAGPTCSRLRPGSH